MFVIVNFSNLYHSVYHYLKFTPKFYFEEFIYIYRETEKEREILVMNTKMDINIIYS